MRIAVLADIHGNLDALQAVLEDLSRIAVDSTMLLGDLLSGPLDAAGTANLLRRLAYPSVRGNHERYLLDFDPEKAGPSDAVAHAQIDAGDLTWLATFPQTMQLADGEILACHGTPQHDDVYFLEQVIPAGMVPSDAARIERLAAGNDVPVILCGHTHLPRLYRREAGGLVINPGSVGLQAYEDDAVFPHKAESGSPHARYAIVEKGSTGWSVEFRAIAYDWDRAARLAAGRDRPDWARALATGRM
jgi:putative phosphoesterase